MMGFGIISIMVASFSLLRQKDIKRLFAYSSIEHMGIATFAFGLGGPVATFGALLHMLVHSLTSHPSFSPWATRPRCTGRRKWTRSRAHPREPPRRMGARAGRDGDRRHAPFGVFTSEFLILTATIKDAPLLAPFLLLGLGVSFAALFRRVQPMVMGTIPPYQHRLKVAHIPVILHLALVLVLGLYMPKFLAGWFQSAVELLK